MSAINAINLSRFFLYFIPQDPDPHSECGSGSLDSNKCGSGSTSLVFIRKNIISFLLSIQYTGYPSKTLNLVSFFNHPVVAELPGLYHLIIIIIISIYYSFTDEQARNRRKVLLLMIYFIV